MRSYLSRPVPFLLHPASKDYLWGGTRLNDDFSKRIASDIVAETWECSTHPDGVSIASSGEWIGMPLNEILHAHPEYLGEHARGSTELPVLVKFIDAKRDLSVQVHPSDEFAREHENGQNGKTEMWYVMQADKDAELVMGFNREMTRMDYVNVLKNNTLQSVLNHEQVKKNDVYFIPAGRVHALGPGIMVAEIQQTSDTTYRIYDWDRIDVAGMRRELHVQQSVEAIDGTMPEKFKTEVPDVMNKTVSVVDCQYFVTNLLQLQGEMEKDYSNLDSFVILMPLEGFFALHWENGAVFVKAGECVLIPNVIKKVAIRAEQYCKLLEIYCQIEDSEF